jgi:tetratricopeptide (TPR) repeat protein
MLCLEHRMQDVTALASTLSSADASTVRFAVRATSALTPIESCSDLATVMAGVAPPPATIRAAVEALRVELAGVRTLRVTGRYTDADRRIAALVTRARELAYAPVLGEVLLELGEIRTKLDDKTAITTFDEAARTAYAASDDGVAARAWIAIVYAAGNAHTDAATAESAAKMAKAALARMPNDDRLQGQLAANEGQLLHARGDYRAALERYEAAGARFSKLSPRQTELEASLRNALANTHAALGNVTHASALLREAITMRQETLGAAHPDTIVNRANLGTMLSRQGNFEEALVELDGAIAAAEQSLGPRHPDLANYLANSVNALEPLGRKAEALERARRAHAIYEAALGADDARTLMALTIVAKLLPPKEALPLFERALALQEQRLGPKHPALATTLNNLGQAHVDASDDANAIVAYARALAIAEAALGPQHGRLAYSLVGLGNAYARQRQWSQALPMLKRAVAILDKVEADPASRGEVRIALADAMWRSKTDRAGARAIAEEARAAFVTAKDAPHAAEVERWLAAHR